MSGCIPEGLRDVAKNDLRDINLPFCDSLVTCGTEDAASDVANNPGLVADCEALLSARDTLTGSAALNWPAGTPIGQWEGVILDGSPPRVTALELSSKGLSGEIPAVLGGLSHLQHVNLSKNQLSGEIPAELGNLSNLTRLVLGHNQLIGEIPPELGDLSNLQLMEIWSNQLSGEIPAELGNLTNLQWLGLSYNQLSGEIPPELGGLANLTDLYLAFNRLTGCIPEGLRYVAANDLHKIGLPYCDVLLSALTVSPGSLVPQFDPYRTEYSASVGLSPVTVTVKPTNDHGATFQFLDDNDLVLVDADRTLAGFQVEFSAGTPAIKIRVVLQDSQEIRTYIVTDLGNRYDTNDDRVIQRDEVISAIKDYFNDLITREEAIEVIKLYFSG